MSQAMIPIKLLKESKGSQVLVELKSGDTFTGTLYSVDNFMNIKLKTVTYIEKLGPKFYSCDEVFIRGSTVNSVQLREDILERIEEYNKAQEELINQKKTEQKHKSNQYNNEKTKHYKNNNYHSKDETKDFDEKQIKPRRFFQKEQQKDKPHHISSTPIRGGLVKRGRGH